MKVIHTSHKKFVQPAPRYPHLTAFNALKAGESAYKMRVPFYNNPYQDNPCRSAWIRGFKRAERDFNEAIKLSMKIQESLALEEVEA